MAMFRTWAPPLSASTAPPFPRRNLTSKFSFATMDSDDQQNEERRPLLDDQRATLYASVDEVESGSKAQAAPLNELSRTELIL